jgi:thiol-disulfide isomerase/thioredoxin
MDTRNFIVTATVLFAGLAACAKPHEKPVADSNAPVQTAAPPAIDWIEGDVDAAFERATAEGKPVFLYWGAEWCPPCHELKATVFARPDFIEKTKLFVPVYLDGDTPGAQKWGDAFRVSGYPTLVVLRSDRTELARIIGGMNLSEYDDVLDLVLGDVRPVHDVLGSLQGAQRSLSGDDCKRLAYNGWPVDDSLRKDPEKIAARLQSAVAACPTDARAERARLSVAAAYAALMADSEKLESGKPPTARTTQLVKAVVGFLDDPEAAAGMRDTLSWLGTEFFTAARRSDAKWAAESLHRWVSVTDAAIQNLQLPEAARLEALAVQLQAIKALSVDQKIPPVVADSARQRVDASLAKTYAEHARSGVVNAALWVLDTLEEKNRAREVLTHEMSTAKHPYYYMLELAALEEDRGNQQLAIELFKRAYEESQGAATRFQWGTSYVAALVRMRPRDTTGIVEATLKVIGELDGPDRIYMRTAIRLRSLDSTLRDWNKKERQAEAILAIRKRVEGICSGIPATQSARASCDSFLA